MSRPADPKCIECAKKNWRGLVQPDCYIPGACNKKRSYYRNLDHYRMINRRNHHYHKYADKKCAICDSIDELQVHHIKPQINGGEHTKTNCMTLCIKCHSIVTKYYQAIRGLAQIEENPK